MLNKKQVHSFLKILQIPTDQTPEEIELALKKAGWNSQDAREAVTVLDPEGGKKSKPVAKPKMVAQVTKPVGDAVVKPATNSQSVPQDAGQYVGKGPVPQEDAQDVPPPATPPMPSRPPEMPKPPASPHENPTPQPPRVEPAPRVSIVEPSAETRTIPAQDIAAPQQASPVSFTPNSVNDPQPVTNVTVAPVNQQEMAQQLFRSDNARLNSETITSLLGIDVEVVPDEFETLRSRRNPSLTFPQLLIIVVCSIALAFGALMYGMYLFQVGPFHPTVEAFGL